MAGEVAKHREVQKPALLARFPAALFPHEIHKTLLFQCLVLDGCLGRAAAAMLGVQEPSAAMHTAHEGPFFVYLNIPYS